MIRIAMLLACVAASAYGAAAPGQPGSFGELTTHPLSVLPESLPEEEWLRRALRIAAEQKSAPPYRLTYVGSENGELRYRLEAKEQSQENYLRIPFAVPVEGVTSASFTLDPAQVEVDAPQSPPTVEAFGWVRNVRIDRVTLPISGLSNGVAGELRLLTAPKKNGAEAASIDPARKAAEEKGPVREALRHLVANPEQIEDFAAPSYASIPLPEGEESLPWSPLEEKQKYGTFCYPIPVSATSFYRLSAADLESSGVSVGRFSPSDLRLLLNGEEQALEHIPAPGERGNGERVRPGDAFVFRGEENKSKYSRTNCYWLVARPGTENREKAAIMAPPPGAPAARAGYYLDRTTIEEDHPPVLTRNDQFLTILDYRWGWWTWSGGKGGGAPKSRPLSEPGVVEFDLPGLAADTGSTAALTFEFYVHAWPSGVPGLTVEAQVNGGTTFPLALTSARDETQELKLPASVLRARGNRVELRLLDSSSPAGEGEAGSRSGLQLVFDRLEVEYPRSYVAGPDGLRFSSPADTSAPLTARALSQLEYRITNVDTARVPVLFDVTETAPVRIRSVESGGPGGELRFRVAEGTTRTYELVYAADLPRAPVRAFPDQPDLRRPSNRADYIVISHPDFIEPMAPFVEEKQGKGHAVALVNVQHLYDQFGAGQEGPEAVRRFIRHAVRQWQGSARGPAASAVLLVGDCTSAYRNQFRNDVVNYVPTWSVSDGPETERYASDIKYGQACGTDLLNDVLIGRFSVNNVGDLARVLEKQAVYAARREPGPWRNTLAYVADHSEFEQSVDRVMHDSIPDSFFRKRIRLADEPWTDNFYFPKEIADAKKAKVSPATTAKIRDMFNEGAAIVTYFGHGSPNIWSTERIWFGGDSENSDNLMLRNGPRLPLVINMTCNSGAIDYPMPKWNVCISEDFMRVAEGGAVACYVPSGPGITVQHEKLMIELNRALLDEQVQPLGAALSLASWRYLMAGNSPDLVRMFILLGDPVLHLNIPEHARSDLDSVAAGKAGGLSPASGSSIQVVRQAPDSFEASDISTAAKMPLLIRKDGTGMLGGGDNPTTAAGSVAAVLLEKPDGTALRTAFPVNATRELTVRSWKLEGNSPAVAGQPVRVVIDVENTGQLPLRNAAVAVAPLSADAPVTSSVSPRRNLLPGEKSQLAVEVVPSFGIQRYNLLPAGGVSDARLLVQGEPVVIASAPAPGQEAGKPAAMIDPSSVQLTWLGSGEGALTAQVRFRVYNVTTYGVGELTAALLDGQGKVIADTETTLSAAAPGGQIQAELRRFYSSAKLPPREPVTIKLDPHALRPDYASAPGVPLRLGRETFPDLAITRVDLSPARPTDGETVFLDVALTNRGSTGVGNVTVAAYDGETSAGQPLESRISMPASGLQLDPGSSTTVRLRWDPFRNAGEHKLLVKAYSTSNPDRRDSDNVRTVPLKVLTKYDLRKGPIGIFPTPEDIRQKQLKFVARIYNRGESPAHGVRVLIYPTPERKPEQLLGEVLLDEVPPRSHRDAVLTYKLKPGEESREFTPSFDAFLKGSAQRALQAEEGRGDAGN